MLVTERTLKECLTIIIDISHLHARWLNTFSFLEYVGFRKIVKSQTAESMCLEMLSHAVEEGRHALLLKRLAVKTGGAEFAVYEPMTLLCEKEAKAYFRKLDHHCESAFAGLSAEMKARLTYLYVTLLVEIRALQVYKCYQNLLSTRGLPLVLQGILSEEERHLQSVESELQRLDSQFDLRMQKFRQVEHGLYREYLLALSHQLRFENYANCT